MIDFSKLDKTKTYLGLQYGTSMVAKAIRKYSQCYAPDSEVIPTHVLALIHYLNSWWIYESHMHAHRDMGIPSGVRRYKASKWLEIEEDELEEFEAVPMEFDIEQMEEYIGFPYGIGDIQALMKAALLHNNGEQEDHEGLICSEYLALCHPDICAYYQLPAYCITPAHFQDYIDKHKGEPM